MNYLKTIFLLTLLALQINILAQSATDIELVKDINPLSYTDITDLTDMGNYIMFSANDGINGYELWRSDGTTSGTFMVKDINNSPNAASYPSEFTNINGLLYFTADDGTFGKELWRSDGTAAGTYMVKDLLPGIQSSNLKSLIFFNDKIYFYSTGGNTFKIWETQGTEATTNQLFSESTNYSLTNRELTVFDNKLFFINKTSVSLYYITATNNIPTMVSTSCGTNTNTRILGIVNNKLLIKMSGNGCYGNDFGGNELFVITPGVPNIVAVKNLNGTGSASIYDSFVLNNFLYFAAEDTGTGVELFKTDGTTAGTTIVKNIGGGSADSYPSRFSNFNGILYFEAELTGYGRELWRSDGTVAGTYLVKDINPVLDNSDIDYFTDIGNIGLFRCYVRFPSAQYRLFRTDGTPEGTYQISDLDYVNQIIHTAFTTFFVAREGSSAYKLYKVKYCETSSIFGQNASSTQPIAEQFFRQEGLCNRLICSVLPSTTTNAITGSATAKVFFNNNANFVGRSYEFSPINNPTTAGYKLTLYFSQEEFNDYNQSAQSQIPVNGDDSENGIPNIRILKYPGLSSNGTGEIGSYNNPSEIIDPDDTEITYYATDKRWEVSFTATGAAGYFLQGASTPICTNKNYSIKSGAWNAASTWACGYVPLSTDEVTIKNLHIINLISNQTSGKLTVEPGSELKLNSGAVLTLQN